MVDRPSQLRLAAIFAARISASHGLSLYLAWLAFTKGSAALGGAVLGVRALLILSASVLRSCAL